MKGERVIPDKQIQNVFGNWKRTASGFILTAGALLLGAVILGISFLVASDSIRARPATAEAVMMVEQMMEEEATAAATVVKTDYYLPYPGMLPDNPLYKLKAIRDKLSLWFEFDGEKKARRELMFADKRINAAMFLAEGGKVSLGVTTATKAEKYLEQAATRTMRMANDGKDMKSLLMELAKACAKHAELLDDLVTRVSGDEMAGVEKSTATTRLLQERIEQMLLEAK